MNEERFQRLKEVVTDPLFAEIDTNLHQGRHVNSEETERYGFLRDAQAQLEGFYRQYDCDLRRAADGFFYLVANGDRLGGRRLSGAEMLVGQDRLVAELLPRRKRLDERVAQDTVREEIGKALRALAGLGFVSTADTEEIRLRPALLRFAGPVPGLDDRREALARLIAAGAIESDRADEARSEEEET